MRSLPAIELSCSFSKKIYIFMLFLEAILLFKIEHLEKLAWNTKREIAILQ